MRGGDFSRSSSLLHRDSCRAWASCARRLRGHSAADADRGGSDRVDDTGNRVVFCGGGCGGDVVVVAVVVGGGCRVVVGVVINERG